MDKITLAALLVILTSVVTAEKCKITKEIRRLKNSIDSTYEFATCKYTALADNDIIKVENVSLKYVIFNNSDLKQIPAKFFANCISITELYVNNSRINHLTPGAFANLDRLEELYIQHNQLTKILNGTWQSLENLKKLDLSKNLLTDIHKYYFTNLRSLQQLNLCANRIFHISGYALQSQNLQSLNLKNNYIEYFVKYTFDNLPELEVLDISGNPHNFTFKIPQSLKHIVISNNDHLGSIINWRAIKHVELIDATRINLTDVNNLEIISKYLNISGNNLVEITVTTFANASNLVTLDLSRNNISKINENSFNKLQQLEILNLSYNKIQQLSSGLFQNLSSLSELRLSHNDLNILKYGTFSGLDSLEHLYLDNNQISSIEESSFDILRNLKNLDITYNLIQTFNADKLRRHLKELRVISIDKNDWNCNSLFQVVHNLTVAKIGFSNGTDLAKENVNGIHCSNKDLQPKIPQNIPQNITALNPMLAFDKAFKNSSFYKFFISDYNKISFFNYLEKDFRKAPFFRYFNKGFRNSKFYNYFEKDFQESDFFKQASRHSEKNKKSAEAAPITSGLKSFDTRAYDFASFSSKVTICLIINIALIILIIVFFLFFTFRRQNQYKFVKYVDDKLENIEL